MLALRNRNFPTLWNENTKTPVRFSSWIDEVFDEAFNNWPAASNNTFVPELNVYETDKAFELTIALPGMQKEDFNISYENGLLTISGERKMEHEGNGRRHHRIESRFGRFSRSLPLPADVMNDEKITAKYDNGVLYVTVPKLKEKARKKIEIN